MQVLWHIDGSNPPNLIGSLLISIDGIGSTVSILLRDSNGIPIGSTALQFPPMGHVAKFVDEFIASAEIYFGTVTVSAGGSGGSCVTPAAVAAYDIGSSPGQSIVLPVGAVN